MSVCRPEFCRKHWMLMFASWHVYKMLEQNRFLSQSHCSQSSTSFTFMFHVFFSLSSFISYYFYCPSCFYIFIFFPLLLIFFFYVILFHKLNWSSCSLFIIPPSPLHFCLKLPDRALDKSLTLGLSAHRETSQSCLSIGYAIDKITCVVADPQKHLPPSHVHVNM